MVGFTRIYPDWLSVEGGMRNGNHRNNGTNRIGAWQRADGLSQISNFKMADGEADAIHGG
jgi:hypothetical protein